MKYYISDLHLFHENAIRFDQRPFESVQQMHDTILKNWNDRVMNGDYVYILGDVSMRGKNEDLIAFVVIPLSDFFLEKYGTGKDFIIWTYPRKRRRSILSAVFKADERE